MVNFQLCSYNEFFLVCAFYPYFQIIVLPQQPNIIMECYNDCSALNLTTCAFMEEVGGEMVKVRIYFWPWDKVPCQAQTIVVCTILNTPLLGQTTTITVVLQCCNFCVQHFHFPVIECCTKSIWEEQDISFCFEHCWR